MLGVAYRNRELLAVTQCKA